MPHQYFYTLFLLLGLFIFVPQFAVCAGNAKFIDNYSSNTFIKGASASASVSELQLLKYLNLDHMRLYCMWSYIQPMVPSPLNMSLTVAGLRETYKRDISQLDAFISTINWGFYDEVMKNVIEVLNIVPIVEVFEGTVYGLPHFMNEKGEKTFFDPNNVPHEVYLAYMYRYAAAFVRRYTTKYPTKVYFYQIENELNEAYLAGFASQRIMKVLDNIWKDWNFLTRVLETLYWAVKDQQPNSIVTMNFHSDISKTFHDLLFMKGHYLDALRDWNKYMDVISFDAYPNMYESQPLETKFVMERMLEIKKTLKELGTPDKLVFVMETGYPVEKNQSGLPGTFNFTDANQAEYYRQVIRGMKEAGGNGVVIFHASRSPGMQPPPGGYTEKDVEAFKMLKKLYLENSAWAFFKWVIEKGNVDFLIHRLPDLMEAVEKGWGIQNSEGKWKVAADVVSKEFANIQTKH